ncbi:hypothetical protein BO85DRAFT_452963 [Aspergillus piperis CBS 112811]|uniref:Uncharacterized protein n=1 Tax=Aspergillus piperis CBS 112811 TaxID=1448313 RepID=A0A8G1QVM0_9EURO|nr:hypothetical protein BO85DRAFT_452963 [Aspergillus piperis CBS 112811]RAH53806.1 hypothetical protein BO85DRAFT_452963 [Aspergillus piperis CBS 112811]
MEVQEVFEINCVLDGEESILCRQCCGRRGGCEATPAGALGNAAELVELLDWYRACFFHNAEDEEENAFVNFNEDAIRAANNCVVHLGRAFVQMVATHNRYHGLSVAQKSRRTANYEAFLARRRKIVGVDIEKLCLMPGDPGFVLWTSAKQSFHDGISAAVGLQFDGDRLDEILEWMFEEFPVALGEL